LRRRHDDAVDGRILDDLVQDFDLALRVVGRRFGAEQQDLRADHVAGDRRANIDRIEEAVAGGVRDDGEGQMSVGGMEILGVFVFLRRVFERVAAHRLRDSAFLSVRAGGQQRRQDANACRSKEFAHCLSSRDFVWAHLSDNCAKQTISHL
jgi:hypothetical protein